LIMLHLTDVKHMIIMGHMECNLHFYNSATYGRCQAVFQGKSKDFSYIPKNRVTVPLSKLQILHFRENAASERNVNVAERLSSHMDNEEKDHGATFRKEQDEENDRNQVQGRTAAAEKCAVNEMKAGQQG